MNKAVGFAELTRDAAAGRLRGAWVGVLFGAGWAIYGAMGLAPLGRWLGWASAAIVVAALTHRALRLRTRSRALPAAGPEGRAAARRVRYGFIVVLIAEIVLLNIAVMLLSGPSLRAYWIPAIALVVGAHFLPLAWLFRMKAFWACALAMMAAAALAAVAIGQAPETAGLVVAVESLINAAILWLTAASGLSSLRRRLDAVS